VALTWLALLVAAAAVWPTQQRRAFVWLGVALLLSAPWFMPVGPVSEILWVAVVLGTLAAGQAEPTKRVLVLCAAGAIVLAVFRLTCASVPVVWFVSEHIGRFLGACAAWLTRRPLSIGGTFAGLDFLVLTLAIVCGWFWSPVAGMLRHRSELRRGFPNPFAGFYAVVAVLVAHGAYLAILAFAADLAEALPAAPAPAFKHPYVPPDWSWVRAVRQLLPWNVPALAAALHLTVIVTLFRWAPHTCGTPARAYAVPGSSDLAHGDGPQESGRPAVGPRGSVRDRPQGRASALVYGPLAAALLLPVVATWTNSPCHLTGKRFLANRDGHLDWERPQHDRYGRSSAGRYGMLPVLLESLGARLSISSECTADELQDADGVLWLGAAGEIPSDQMDRLWDYVRGGGTLLVAAGPVLREGGVESSFNQLLEPTAIRVRQDVAISATGGWQQASLPLAHPAMSGLDRPRNRAGTDSGASLAIGWPAVPLLVGRWGWSDPGSDAALTNVFRWEGGEQLGDLVLAAEQEYGRGTVIVLGDSSSLTNEGSVRGYEWTGRLLSYLANRSSSPLSWWRQLLTLVLATLLAVWALAVVRTSGAPLEDVATASAAARRPRSPASRLPTPVTSGAWNMMALPLCLAVALGVCRWLSRQAGRVVPDGRTIATQAQSTPYRLAYLAAAHVEAYSDSDWGFDSLNGLALTLMRNGYLVAMLPEVSRDRLERAEIVVSIAPAGGFTAAERGWLHDFMDRGGICICTVGAEQAAASAAWLREYGFRVPQSPAPTGSDWREPEPMGHFRSLYLNAQDYGAGDYRVGVLFHTAWPVEADAPDAETLVRGPRDEPIVAARRVGQGRLIVIGDSNFALNKNLEYVGGEPFEGRYENAHFWRWLLSRVTDRPEWVPPEPPPLVIADDDGEESPKP
jgi:hypothetical protein